MLAVGRVTMYCPGKTLRGSALASDARQYGDTAARTTPINALNLDLSVKRSMPGYELSLQSLQNTCYRFFISAETVLTLEVLCPLLYVRVSPTHVGSHYRPVSTGSKETSSFPSRTKRAKFAELSRACDWSAVSLLARHLTE